MSTWRYQTANGLVFRNDNGGLFQPGRMYQLPRKTEVAEVYLLLCKDKYPQRPIINKTAQLSKVSWGFANQVVSELKALGVIVVDPEITWQQKHNVLGPGQKLSTDHEMFPLCLRTLDLARPLYNYVQELNKQFRTVASPQSISDCFKKL